MLGYIEGLLQMEDISVTFLAKNFQKLLETCFAQILHALQTWCAKC